MKYTFDLQGHVRLNEVKKFFAKNNSENRVSERRKRTRKIMWADRNIRNSGMRVTLRTEIIM